MSSRAQIEANRRYAARAKERGITRIALWVPERDRAWFVEQARKAREAAHRAAKEDTHE